MNRKHVILVVAITLFALLLAGCGGKDPVSEAELKVASIADKVVELPNNPELRQIKSTVTVVNRDETTVKDVRVTVEYSEQVKEHAEGPADSGYVGNTTLEPGESFEFISRQAIKASALDKDKLPNDWSVLAKITLNWQDEKGQSGTDVIELTAE